MLTLLATVFIIYLLWILIKPLIISYAQRKYTERINDMFGQAFGGVPPTGERRDGRDDRDSAFGGFYRRRKRKIFSKSDGEYIDFVEIEGATAEQTASQHSSHTHNPREPQISDAEWEDIK